jgi:phosphate:Na+ symporter
MILTLAFLIGGLAIFLLGLEFVSSGLKAVVSGRLRATVAFFTRNRFRAVGVGIFLALGLGSCTAATVMLQALAQAGLMGLGQALGVILGSNIGVTLIVQILIFKVGHYALFIVALGLAVSLISRYERDKELGRILMGVGLLFFGMELVRGGFAPEQARAGLFAWLEGSLASPYRSFLIALLFTALVQRGTATVILAIGFASARDLSLVQLLPVVLAANLGNATMPLVASITTGRRGRRIALGALLCKVIGVLIFFPLMGPFSRLVEAFTAFLTTGGIERAIANAHTLYNLILAFLLLPFLGLLVYVLEKIVKEVSPFKSGALSFIDLKFLSQPEEALSRAHKEVGRMGELAADMLERSFQGFEADAPRLLEDLSRQDDSVDFLEEVLTDYLTRLPEESLSEEGSEVKSKLLYVVKDIEHIADAVSKEFLQLAEHRSTEGLALTTEGLKELRSFHTIVTKSFRQALKVLSLEDPDVGLEILRLEAEIDERKRQIHSAHLERVARGIKGAQEASTIFTDALLVLRRIHYLISDIIRVLEWQSPQKRPFRLGK